MLIDLPSTRPVFAYAQDYLHGERVELHRHSRAQLIHALSGVVTVGTAEGTWVVPPGRGVWLPAGIEHALRFAGQVRMRTLFIARKRATTYRRTAGWWTCRRCCGN